MWIMLQLVELGSEWVFASSRLSREMRQKGCEPTTRKPYRIYQDQTELVGRYLKIGSLMPSHYTT